LAKKIGATSFEYVAPELALTFVPFAPDGTVKQRAKRKQKEKHTTNALVMKPHLPPKGNMPSEIFSKKFHLANPDLKTARCPL
jgi:hypothetical protein